MNLSIEAISDFILQEKYYFCGRLCFLFIIPNINGGVYVMCYIYDEYMKVLVFLTCAFCVHDNGLHSLNDCPLP